MIKIKRIYEPATKDDGYRILVDRLWPRGVTKKKAQLAAWYKTIAPTDQLRRWFGHDPEKWKTFKQRYGKELQSQKTLLSEVVSLERKHKTVTLLFATKYEKHTHALVLQQLLEQRTRLKQ